MNIKKILLIFFLPNIFIGLTFIISKIAIALNVSTTIVTIIDIVLFFVLLYILRRIFSIRRIADKIKNIGVDGASSEYSKLTVNTKEWKDKVYDNLYTLYEETEE